MLLGAAIVGYGLLVIPVSALGGGHLVAIGLCTFLSAFFAMEWSGRQFDLDEDTRRQLWMGFGVLAIVLAVLFVVLGYASFTGVAIEESEEAGLRALGASI